MIDSSKDGWGAGQSPAEALHRFSGLSAGVVNSARLNGDQIFERWPKFDATAGFDDAPGVASIPFGNAHSADDFHMRGAAQTRHSNVI